MHTRVHIQHRLVLELCGWWFGLVWFGLVGTRPVAPPCHGVQGLRHGAQLVGTSGPWANLSHASLAVPLSGALNGRLYPCLDCLPCDLNCSLYRNG